AREMRRRRSPTEATIGNRASRSAKRRPSRASAPARAARRTRRDQDLADRRSLPLPGAQARRSPFACAESLMITTINAKAKRYFLIGLFLVCMCGLMLQIIETRILSVVSYYHLAFFAISMAMFGMTGGSLFVYFRQSWFPTERLLENMAWICAAFGLAVVVSALLLISTTVIGSGNIESLLMTLPMVALLWLKLILVLATPYFFAGMAISLALTRSPWPVPLVYGIDLIGAATGCLVVLTVLTLMDAVSAL